MYKTSRTSPSPLTVENLMALEDTLEKTESISNEILTRYCNEMNSMSNSLHKERCQSAPPHQRDVVVASPRLLSFPYHNDSLFLPTAEKTQYHHLHSSSTSSSFTSRADSFSLSPESDYLASRPHSATNISFSTMTDKHERRSLPIRLDYPKMIVSKTSGKQQRFLRRSSSFGSNTTISQAPVEKQPWMKRILKFLGSKNKQKKQPETHEDEMNQVWYCQYSSNPSTNFENYFHHHQYQHQRSPIYAS